MGDRCKDVLRIQWLLILQGIVIVIVILTMSTWMGYDYNEDPVENSPVALWRSTIERLQDAIIDIGMEYRYQNCNRFEQQNKFVS